MMIKKMYEQVVGVLGTPQSCSVSRVRAALQNLQTLAKLPAKVQRRKSVVMFYLGVTSTLLSEAQAFDVGLVEQEPGESVPYSVIIGRVKREVLQPVIDSLTLVSSDEETVCQVHSW